MNYRIGTMRDLDAICQLIKDAVEEMERQGIHQWDEVYPARMDFEEDIRKNSLYLAYEGNEMVALYVISGECEDAYQNGAWRCKDEDAYILHRFCVSPKVQNIGIGKKVLMHIEEQVKLMGYRSIRLDTYTENPFAQSLYRHNGYVPVGYADWRKGRFDLMEKKL